VVKRFHNLGLAHCVLDLVILDQVLFFHDFKSKYLPIVSLFAFENPSKRPLAKIF